MKQRLIKTLPALILVCSLTLTFGFITGFLNAGSPRTDPAMFFGADEGEPGEEEDMEENEEEESEDIEELEKWSCPVCGFVYDPALGIIDPDPLTEPDISVAPGIPFAELPLDWSCPNCGTAKAEFEESELKYTDPEAWLAHLQHILESRSKHLAVLNRVIENHLSMNPVHPSLSGLNNAIQSSSKAVLKAEEAIKQYLEYMASLNPGNGTGQEEDEEINNIEQTSNELPDNKDKNENSDKDNKIKGNSNGSNHSNNGKGNGKNK